MRPIDADALKFTDIIEAENQIYGNGSWKFAQKCKERVDNAPTIEPKQTETQNSKEGSAGERKHGEWIFQSGVEWFCSNCGLVEETEGSWEHPLERGKDYCEHCGARMKGSRQ